MNKKLYNIMDWAGIEEIVYGECSHPEKLLGAHTHGNNTLIQCFFPESEKVSLILKDNTEVKMECADDKGYYAALVPGKNISDYTYSVEYKKSRKVVKKYCEVYFDKKVNATPGAVVTKESGVDGVRFTVYAPNALRVSVVGEFNNYDENLYQMIKDDDTGYFSLFVPGLKDGAKYRYSILAKGWRHLDRLDPYATEFTADYENACVSKASRYKWTDSEFVKSRNAKNPLNIYECSLLTVLNSDEKKPIEKFVMHVKNMGYTHVELMPVFEYFNEMSMGYDSVAYYAISDKMGKADTLKKFVDLCHKENIGVIVQLPFAHFADGKITLKEFDGECLYEYADMSRQTDPVTGKYCFNLENAEVTNLLIGSALNLCNNFHVDGFKLLDVASMIYLDYNRSAYAGNAGDNRNLAAVAFVKKFNETVHKNTKGLITIAEDMSLYGGNTSVNEDSLGFDFTINAGLKNELIDYITTDPINRKHKHALVSAFEQYRKNENFINAVSHYDVDGNKGGLIAKMPGSIEDKFNNLKAFMGYLYLIPGMKSMIMGQEIAEFDSISFDRALQTELLEFENHLNYKKYVKDLNKLYQESEVFNTPSCEDDIFEYINANDAESNVVSFIRKAGKKFVVVVVNFANCGYEKFRVGVPEKGKYSLSFTSANAVYGGTVETLPTYKSRLETSNGFDSSIRIELSPLSVNVFEFEPYTEAEIKEMKRKKAAREKKVVDRIKANEKLKNKKLKLREELKKAYFEELNKALGDNK